MFFYSSFESIGNCCSYLWIFSRTLFHSFILVGFSFHFSKFLVLFFVFSVGCFSVCLVFVCIVVIEMKFLLYFSFENCWFVLWFFFFQKWRKMFVLFEIDFKAIKNVVLSTFCFIVNIDFWNNGLVLRETLMICFFFFF